MTTVPAIPVPWTREQREEHIWRTTHPDYRTGTGARRAVLTFDAGGTTLVTLRTMPADDLERICRLAGGR